MKMTQAFAVAAAALVLSVGPARAGILVYDDFESYGPTSITNFAGFSALTVSGGTVDFVHEPEFGLSTPYGVGLVDLDGSSSNGGRLSSAFFAFNAGDTLVFDFDASGNQRDGASDNWRFGFIFSTPTDLSTVRADLPGLPSTAGAQLNVNSFFRNVTTTSAQPWGHYLASFTALEAGSAQAYLESDSNDNVGPLIDNFRVSSVDAGVPEPATWGLMIAGLGLAGATLRRRRLFA